MVLPYERSLKDRSRQLRKNMTVAEKLLWSKINLKQVNGLYFCRQKPIGKYIADFYCAKAKLVIEVDGGHHFSNDNVEYDEIRNKYMGGLGLSVLRFMNTEVLIKIKDVLEVIKKKISDQNPL